MPTHPGNGLLRGYGLSTCIEGRESLVGLADAYNPMTEDQCKESPNLPFSAAGNQPMDSMIFRYWSSSNALSVAVRMLPPLAIEMASLANASSFGASMTITMS